MRDFYLDTLRQVVSTPTTSYHEERVGQLVCAFLERYGINYQIDCYGNIIAHYQHSANGAAIRPLALMAHTDHPAFELVAAGAPPEFGAANWTSKLLGGVSPQCFEKPVPVRLFARDSTTPTYGRVVGYQMGESGPRDVTLFLHAEDSKLEPGDWGIWDLTDFELNGDIINARVMDDLVGCTGILLTLWRLAQEKADGNLYGVFTRAEEVGLIGADLLFQSGLLPKDTLVVSIEASKAIPGAVQGAGPVIRAGDRGTTFSDEAELILRMAAESMGGSVVARTPQTTKIQRQLMTGGQCEATSATLNGYAATGLAFPLGNYHNIADDGSFDILPENIHLQDFLTGIELLQQAALQMPRLPDYVAAQRVKLAVKPEMVARLTSTARPSINN